MNFINLESIEQFHLIFRAYRGHKGFGHWFRGQADSNWELLPKAGRKEYFLPKNRDIGRFNDWAKQAIAYSSLPQNRLECLAVAQHHGLATRLLDWSQNPLVAAYFAVTEKPDLDGAIYILEPLNSFVSSESSLEDIAEHDGVICYIPRSISPRVLNQKGMFTIHCPPNKEVEICESQYSKEHLNLTKINIPSSLKFELEKMLDDYGVNSSALFPDMDGLAQYKNRETIEMAKKQHNKSINRTKYTGDVR